MKFHPRSLPFFLWWWMTTTTTTTTVVWLLLSSPTTTTTNGLEIPPTEAKEGEEEQQLLHRQELEIQQGKDAIVDPGIDPGIDAAAAEKVNADAIDNVDATDSEGGTVKAGTASDGAVVVPELSDTGGDRDDDVDDQVELDPEQLAAKQKQKQERPPEYFYMNDKESVVIEFEAPRIKGEEYKADFLYRPNPHEIRIVEFYAQYVHPFNCFFFFIRTTVYAVYALLVVFSLMLGFTHSNHLPPTSIKNSHAILKRTHTHTRKYTQLVSTLSGSPTLL
jgi:hypothetical protein